MLSVNREEDSVELVGREIIHYSMCLPQME